MVKIIRKVLFFGLGCFVAASITGVIAAVIVFNKISEGLPAYDQLADYEPPVVSRVHAGDGRLLAEFSAERRIFVPIEAVPDLVKQAFISAEDKRFYTHNGVDPMGVVRAMVTNVRNFGTGRRLVGASTITQQVAQNFLLTKEVSYERKLKEAILATRIEKAFTKDEILELYLNQIYLGARSYGVAAAAINYFNKPLDALTVGEAAYLAGLPKAPNNYHPVRRPEAAKARRNYVLARLAADGYIDEELRALEADAEIDVAGIDAGDYVAAPYFAEEIRREIVERYGEDSLYMGGLSVRSTLDPQLQKFAVATLRAGLETYDRRHGWRGPVGHLDRFDNWARDLADTPLPLGAGDWRLALVTDVKMDVAGIGFADGTSGEMPLAELDWAREWRPEQEVGPEITNAHQVVDIGDIVLVAWVGQDADANAYRQGTYALRQVPEIQGALVALDPHTGRVLAMVGGYDAEASVFNRATQAWRQPGSAFKPFVYMAALDNGFTPSTIVMDAPIVIDQGPELGKWKPENYANRFYGPSPMRMGIEKSRNVMTVRLAQAVGIDKVAALAEAFGVTDEMPRILSMAIGAGETTLMRLTTAYSMIVNGGHRIEPTLIDRIQDRTGASVFRHDTRPCVGCFDVAWVGQAPPVIPDIRARVIDEATAYQMVSMLQGVIERGTGRRIREVGKPLAGKTGTTNDSFDAWFIGFTPDLAVGIYTGFDTPRSLGQGETGSSIAVPMFRDFMADALADQPATPFRVPQGVRLIRVNVTTGELAGASTRNVILEAFKEGTAPPMPGSVAIGVADPFQPSSPLRGRGTSGIY